jgi:multiple sugar transport system substrate-binding protein/raffinose/stachyose/melibiose transport system substrate-binding protein
MKKTFKTVAAIGLTSVLALSMAACGGDTPGGDSDGPVKMQLWHNSTTGDGKAYWEAATAAYTKANPDVTFEITAIQNEDLDGKLQTAINSGDTPDIFMQRGGKKLADMVAAGAVQEMTYTDQTKEEMGTALDSNLVDGKRYVMPLAVLPGGLFYSQDLFDAAGITKNPTTITELNDAVSKLKASGVEAIALGGNDAWPAAHWYYWFALRECSQEAIETLSETTEFTDECWL